MLYYLFKSELDNLQRQVSLPNIISPTKNRFDGPISKLNFLRKSSISISNDNQVNRNFNKMKTQIQTSTTMEAIVNKFTTVDLINNQNNLSNEDDLEQQIDEIELQISKLKQENSKFLEYVDDLNDSYFINDQENKKLKAQISKLDKQIVDVNKDRAVIKKTFDKTFPDLKDKIIYNDVNIDVLLNTNGEDLNSDIVNYIGKSK